MQTNPFSIFLILCSGLFFLLAVYSWIHRTSTGAAVFACLMVSGAIYTFGYSMELASQSLSLILFWSKFQYVGIVAFPALWLVFVLQYTGRDRWITSRNLVLIFALPVVTLLLKFTDDFHHLIYRSFWLDYSGLIPLLAIDHGPFYWVIFGYTLVGIVGGIILLLPRQANSPLLYRWQTFLMILSGSFPLLVYVLYVIGIQPFPGLKNLDLNPFAFFFMSMGVSWVIFRFHLFDLAPVARETLIENLQEGVVVLDAYKRVVDTNPAALKIFFWDHQLWMGKPVEALWKSWPNLLSACTSGESKPTEIQHRNGETNVFYDVTITDLVNKNGRKAGQLVVIHDITARKNIEQELQRARDITEKANDALRKAWSELEIIAATDKLTGAFNRRKFEELITVEIDRVDRYHSLLSLIIFDIDHFKQVNDRYGHHAGDHVLVELAQIIFANMRKMDSLTRWGGEEFIILTPGINLEQTRQMGEKIRKLIAEHNFTIAGNITISLGLAEYVSGDTVDSFIQRADDALYRAKANGRNQVVTG